MSDNKNSSDSDLEKKINESSSDSEKNKKENQINNAEINSSDENGNVSLKIEEDKFKSNNKDSKKDDVKIEEIENKKESEENNKIEKNINKSNNDFKMTKKDKPKDYLHNNFNKSMESKNIENYLNFSLNKNVNNINEKEENNENINNKENLINKEIENKKEENKIIENNDNKKEENKKIENNNNEKNNKNKINKEKDSSSDDKYSKSSNDKDDDDSNNNSNNISDNNKDDDNNNNSNSSSDNKDNNKKNIFERKFEDENISSSKEFFDNKKNKNYNYNKRSFYNKSNYNEPNNFNINKNKRNENINKITNEKLYKSNLEIIQKISDLFSNDQIKNEDAYKIIKLIYLSPRMTIFEIMNTIICEKNIILLQKKYQFNEENDQRQYEPRYSIYENKNSGDLTIEHKNVLDNFKIYNNESNPKLQKNFYYTSKEDKRRKLSKDNDNLYMYVPILNEEEKIKNEETNIYCNNIYELNYHSLKYKTILCRNKDCYYKKNNIDYLCPFSHNIDTDFRLIYKYQNPEICKFMNELVNKNYLPFESYLQYYEIPRNFCLSDFKIFPCAFKDKCGYDSHLCLMYHNIDEKRRPPLLFRYSKNECECKKKGVYRPEKCPYGDFCMNVHSRAEYNYHKDHFRKIFPCTRKKQNGLCIFYKTCYGKHEEDKNNNYNNNIFNSVSSLNSNNTIKNLNVKEKKSEEINFDLEKQINEKIEEEKNNLNKKINNAGNLLKIFLCKNCNNIPNSNEYEFLKECKHILCDECFKKSIKENKSCPICKKEIGNNAVFKLQFQK